MSYLFNLYHAMLLVRDLLSRHKITYEDRVFLDCYHDNAIFCKNLVRLSCISHGYNISGQLRRNITSVVKYIHKQL